MSDKDIITEHPEFQRMLEHIDKHRNDSNFPHIATKEGQHRVLELKVTDPVLAGVTLPMVMYRKDALDVLPGLEWQTTGMLGNGGYIRTTDLIDWMNNEKSTIVEDAPYADDYNHFINEYLESAGINLDRLSASDIYWMKQGVGFFAEALADKLGRGTHPLNVAPEESVHTQDEIDQATEKYAETPDDDQKVNT